MLEINSPPRSEGSSIPEPARGNPYRDLAALAERLSVGLEDRAQSCQSISERRRLGILSAAAAQVYSCLSNTGVKSGLDHRASPQLADTKAGTV